MPIDKRTFVVSNLNRDEIGSNNNDVTITLPDSIFSGKIESINMKHMFIDFDTETLGNTNYEFFVTYPITSSPTLIRLDIRSSGASIIETDSELASLIASSINSALGVVVFQVFFDQNVISDFDVYRDNSELLGSYSIFTSNNVPFKLDFSPKTSVGPLIGFGNGVYTNSYIYKGGNVRPIYPYESIHVSNKAYDTVFKQYDQPTDIGCKMDLYNSNNQLISNYLDPRDATISLPIVNGYIGSINEFISYLETEINRYSDQFADAPVFSVSFDNETYKFTISNDKNVKFGIGFRFNRSDGSNNFGSLHTQLGFKKRNYLGYTSITSVDQAKIFDKSYIGEYVFVCSDLIRYNYDASLIVAESAGGFSQYESIFTIPISQIKEKSYAPTFEDEHKVRINASMLAKKYNEGLMDPKTINFYLKLSSGRHIKLNTQWIIKCEIEYIN